MEEWKLIEEFPNYEVSVLGKVRRKCNERLLSVRPSEKYYYVVALRKDNKTFHRFVHTLVGRTFLPEYREGLFILHRNEELPFPQINHLSNLWAGTKKQNNRDAINKGRHIPFFKKADVSGENNPSSTLTWEDVRKFRELHKQGRSILSLSKEFNVVFSTMHRVITHQTWKE